MTLPRFSLRLLLLAVAVFCVWLAWERSVVANRSKIKRALSTGESLVFLEASNTTSWVNGKQVPVATVSWLRRQLGDEAVQEILVLPGVVEGNVAMAKRWFPEAAITPLDL
jgi:hypothetical protein